MDFWIYNYLGVALLSIILAGIIIPKILLIAFRKNLFDKPDPRKIHHGTVPRLGGFAFTPVICFAIALLSGICNVLSPDGFTYGMSFSPLTVSMGFCGLLSLYLVGMADDLVGVRYSAKFAAEIICGIFLIAGGLELDNLGGIFGIYDIPWWAAWPLTLLTIVFVINAINLIDGLDGLASGLSAITFIIYGIVLAAMHEYFYATVAFAALGVLVPFFYYNVFGNVVRQRKIFMGDTGSLTIGVLIVFLGLRLLDSSAEGCDIQMPSIMTVILSPLIIPCFDVVRVFLYRIRHHANPFLPDCNHIHHRLLDAGFMPHAAMITIVSASAALCIMNTALSLVMNINFILLIDIALMCVWNEWLHRRGAAKGVVRG